MQSGSRKIVNRSHIGSDDTKLTDHKQLLTEWGLPVLSLLFSELSCHAVRLQQCRKTWKAAWRRLSWNNSTSQRSKPNGGPIPTTSGRI
eukprot:1141533-Amphidinium_carterae.1